MNKQELKGAILKIHASDNLRKEVLTMNATPQNGIIKTKTAKVMVAVAALIALMATTALAAPVIYNALVSGHINTDGTSWTESAGGNEWTSYHVKVDVEMNTDAPEIIEKFYIPKLSDGYVQCFGLVYGEQQGFFAWTHGEENWEDQVRFWQYAGGTYNPEEAYAIVHMKPGVTPETKMVQLGEITGYLVEDDGGYGSKHFLWSNGEYLYQLEVPDEYTDEDITEVLSNIVQVEDIQPYCIGVLPKS